MIFYFLVLAMVGLASAWAVRGRRRRGEAPAPPEWLGGSDWLEDFSSSRYLPLLRMIESDDEVWLRKQPGFEPSMLKRMRARRWDITMRYLALACQDYSRLQQTIRERLAASRQVGIGRADLEKIPLFLVKQQVRFTLLRVSLHVRLVLHRVGAAEVDFRPMLASLDSLADCAHSLSAA